MKYVRFNFGDKLKGKKAKLVLEVLFLLLITTKIFSQGTDIINCDSLDTGEESMLHIPIDKHPSLVRSFAEVQNEFSEKVDSNLFANNIYVKVYVDTSGYTNCLKIVRGNHNITDTIAINFVSFLKFSPAEFRGKKIPLFITVPLYCSKVNETSTLIRNNGKWFDKKDK